MNYLNLLFATLLFPIIGFTQCYEIQQRPYYPDPFTGGSNVATSWYDDIHSGIIDIGFPFCFFGDTVSQCVVSSNGYVSFNLANANTYSPWTINAPIPNSDLTPTHFSIMAPWQDLRPFGPDTSGFISDITYSTYGIPPYRRFVVSYNEIPMYNCTYWLFSNQVVLYESYNYIDINIGNKPFCSWNDSLAIEGIQNQDGTVAYAVPGRNYPEKWSAQYDSYRFVPVCDCPSDTLPLETLISGHVFVDENQNCTQDQNEPPLQNIRIDLQPGNLSAWTNSLGEYVFSVGPGNYTVEHSLQNPWYLGNICPNGPIAVTAIANSNFMNLDFADTIADFVDVVVDFWINPHDSCLLPLPMLVEVCNNGTLPATSIYVTAEVPEFVNVWGVNMYPTSATSWEFTLDSLQAGECANFYFFANSNCDSTMVGQLACFSADAIPAEYEQDTLNNHYSYCDTVGLPYDPNDMRVLSQIPEQGWRTQEYIDDDHELTYMIRFQNIGTAPAQNVIIRDTLSQFLDPQSVQIISASHSYFAQMVDGVLSFHFLGIQLPDSSSNLAGSMGSVTFKIKQQFGNPLGTVIENRAEIYFDQNEAVVTNTTENEIFELTSVEDAEMGEINLYPNPTNGVVFISNSNARNAIRSIYVFDLQGRALHSEARSGITQVDLRGLGQGIYLVQIETELGSTVKRLVKN